MGGSNARVLRLRSHDSHVLTVNGHTSGMASVTSTVPDQTYVPEFERTSQNSDVHPRIQTYVPEFEHMSQNSNIRPRFRYSIWTNSTANSSMWVSLRLAPITHVQKRLQPSHEAIEMASQSSAKFSEWASCYRLSAETIDGLVKEGIECQAALAGLKEAELEQLRNDHRLSLGQYSQLRGLRQLCKSKRADEKPSTDVAMESANSVEGEIAWGFPTFYRRKFTEAPVEPTTTKFQPKTTVATSKGK